MAAAAASASAKARERVANLFSGRPFQLTDQTGDNISFTRRSPTSWSVICDLVSDDEKQRHQIREAVSLLAKTLRIQVTIDFVERLETRAASAGLVPRVRAGTGYRTGRQRSRSSGRRPFRIRCDESINLPPGEFLEDEPRLSDQPGYVAQEPMRLKPGQRRQLIYDLWRAGEL